MHTPVQSIQIQNITITPQNICMSLHSKSLHQLRRDTHYSDFIFANPINSYKCNHMVCFCKIPHSTFLRFIHVITYINSIRFYCWVTFHFMNMSSLFIYSLTDGHLGCFQKVLDVMNIIRKNILIGIFLWTHF